MITDGSIHRSQNYAKFIDKTSPTDGDCSDRDGVFHKMMAGLENADGDDREIDGDKSLHNWRMGKYL